MLLSRADARALDQQAMSLYGVPGIVLMENAGRHMADLLQSLGIQGPVVVCCGTGNNGGDGLVIARHLDNARVPVRVLLFTSPENLSGDAAVNAQIVRKSHIPLEVFPAISAEELRAQLAEADWVVDALFGSGLRGPVRPPLDGVIEGINSCNKRVFAVDIPSGLDCDTGSPFGATVKATVTATVAAMKKGFLTAGAHGWLGQVHVIDMGAPRHLLETFSPK